MEKLRLRDIDLLSLKKLSSQGGFSTLYTDGNLCYKLLDGLYLSEKRDLYNMLGTGGVYPLALAT